MRGPVFCCPGAAMRKGKYMIDEAIANCVQGAACAQGKSGAEKKRETSTGFSLVFFTQLLVKISLQFFGVCDSSISQTFFLQGGDGIQDLLGPMAQGGFFCGEGGIGSHCFF